MSDLIKKDLITNYNIMESKVLTIYNPYDLERINYLAEKPIREQHRGIFEGKVIITVGRLNHLKDTGI